MKWDESVIKEVIIHAEEEYPKESCGVVVSGKYIRCKNVAKTPEEHFIISPNDYKKALKMGDIEAVVHSHPDSPCTPSVSDRLACDEMETPWIILSVMDGEFDILYELLPNKVQPLIGREFIHGYQDCLSIILDFYQREMGVDLGNYEREDDWWNNGKDYYNELLPKAGFVKVSDLKHGDVVLMKIRSKVANHAAVFLEDGVLSTEEVYPSPHSILHHMYGQDSKRDPYGGYWLDKTESIWRYKGES